MMKNQFQDPTYLIVFTATPHPWLEIYHEITVTPPISLLFLGFCIQLIYFMFLYHNI